MTSDYSGSEERFCRWVEMGQADLGRARHWSYGGDHLMCAFHCEQAAEKYLKALLILRTQGAPPRTHDLGGLGDRLDLPQELRADAHLLSLDYAPTRYPDAEVNSPIPYDESGSQQRLRMAEDIIAWVRKSIGEEE